MQTLTIVQSLIFLSYIGFLMYRFNGPLKSISDSWYKLEDPTRWLFLVFTWGLGGTMIFQATEDTPLFFLSAAGLFYCGAASQFKWEGAYTNVVHYLGAFVGIVAALFGLWLGYGIWWPMIVWTSLVGILRWYEVKNATWWVEILAFLVIVGGLFQR